MIRLINQFSCWGLEMHFNSSEFPHFNTRFHSIRHFSQMLFKNTKTEAPRYITSIIFRKALYEIYRPIYTLQIFSEITNLSLSPAEKSNVQGISHHLPMSPHKVSQYRDMFRLL